MPNWCENNLSIAGSIDDMKKILDVIKIKENEYSLLETLYPVPKGLDELEGKDPLNGYYWRLANWGTKWAESDITIGQEYTENEKDNYAVIAFNFETAWSPPIEAFNKISKDYPNLLFCLYYEEHGMGFCGRNIWALGEEEESTSAELVNRWFSEDYLYESLIKDQLTKTTEEK